MKIILCDDQLNDLQLLQNLVNDFFYKNHLSSPDILCFNNAKQLLFELEDRAKGDLYILDIDMPEYNGIELAESIRLYNPMSIIYFYTSHTEFATEGYRVDARRFLIKGGKQEYFNEALAYAVSEYQRKLEETITIFSNRDTLNIPISDIIYVHRDGRQVAIHTHSMDTIFTYGRLKDYFQKIGKSHFVWIDRSTFINTHYVKRTYQNTLTLFNDENLLISRHRVVDVKKAIALYWKER